MHQEQILVQVELHPNQDAGLSTSTIQPLELRLVDPATGVELYRLTFISPNLTVEKHESIFHLGAYQLRLDVHRSTATAEEPVDPTTDEISIAEETEMSETPQVEMENEEPTAPAEEVVVVEDEPATEESEEEKPSDDQESVVETPVSELEPENEVESVLGGAEEEATVPATEETPAEQPVEEPETAVEEQAAIEEEPASEVQEAVEETTEETTASSEEVLPEETAVEETTEETTASSEEVIPEGTPMEIPELEVVAEVPVAETSEVSVEQEVEPAAEVSSSDPFSPAEEATDNLESDEFETPVVEHAEDFILLASEEPEVAEAEEAEATLEEELAPVAEAEGVDFSSNGEEAPAEFSEFDRAILNDYYLEEAAAIHALISADFDEEQQQLIAETQNTIETFADREGMGPWFLNSRFRDNRDRLVQEAGLFFGEKQEPLLEALQILTRVYLITLLLSKPTTWSSLATQVAIRETRDNFSLLGLLDFQQITESCLTRIEPFVNNNVLYRFRNQVGLLEAVEAC